MIFEFLLICVMILFAFVLWIVIGCLIGSYVARRACEKAFVDMFCDKIVEKTDKLEIHLDVMEKKIDEMRR